MTESTLFETKCEQAAQHIHEADALFIGTGAGMGVDSGLPDFRGDEGFWNAYPPYRHLKLSFSQMANPAWFESDPGFAWGFYGHRLQLYRETIPHHGFNLLIQWGSEKASPPFVFTSNVDGQFQKAGLEEDYIVEVHGSIHYFQCIRPCSEKVWDGSNMLIEVDQETMRAKEPYPICPFCYGVARPNILMFGDYSWIETRSIHQEMCLRDWLNTLRGQKLVVIELGAGQAIPTVRWKCEAIAQKQRAPLIRINPRDVREDHDTDQFVGIRSGALQALEKIQSKLVPT